MKNTADFEKEYINSINASAPDMDALWSKIAACEAADDDISPFEQAVNECEKTTNSAKAIRMIKGFGAAAAVFIAVISVSAIVDNYGIDESSAENSVSFDEVMVENDYEYAEGNDDAIAEDDYEVEEELDDAATITVGAQSGWNYSEECSSVYEYTSLSLADTPSGMYTALSSNTEDMEYFVEADVLSRTEYFLDARIISERMTDSSTVEYTAEVIHLIGDKDVSVDSVVSIVSHSPYTLRTNREYLLPVTLENGVFTVVFDNAPQIEFSEKREIIYHNGWSSLTGQSHTISYPQIYPDDYFYDRMNITAEASLENLFENWSSLRQ